MTWNFKLFVINEIYIELCSKNLYTSYCKIIVNQNRLSSNNTIFQLKQQLIVQNKSFNLPSIFLVNHILNLMFSINGPTTRKYFPKNMFNYLI